MYPVTALFRGWHDCEWEKVVYIYSMKQEYHRTCCNPKPHSSDLFESLITAEISFRLYSRLFARYKYKEYQHNDYEHSGNSRSLCPCYHDDVIKWKHFPRCWHFVRGIHQSPATSQHIRQWRGALVFSLIYAGTESWANHGDAGDLRRYSTHYDVIVMFNDLEYAANIQQQSSCDELQWESAALYYSANGWTIETLPNSIL